MLSVQANGSIKYLFLVRYYQITDFFKLHQEILRKIGYNNILFSSINLHEVTHLNIKWKTVVKLSKFYLTWKYVQGKLSYILTDDSNRNIMV